MPALALVLHTHMPYVEGHGTWPFGEEWLWEALATCYLPLADRLDDGAPLTLSVTPVLLDQLEAEGVPERFATFLRDVRRDTHERDARTAEGEGRADVARELRRAAGRYEEALESLERRNGDVVAALAAHASWTSSATHAVLPLLATDAGIRAQVENGVAAHRARSDGAWGGGFWLPECAWAPHVVPHLARAGARATVVDLTDPLGGHGDPRHLRPLRHEHAAHGPLLVPLDRSTVELVWSDGGYPAAAAYRDSFHETEHRHRPFANDGAVYDPDRASEQAREDARHFVAHVARRLDQGPLSVCALDTELLGLWWAEGLTWLDAVLEEAPRAGVEILPLDEALAREDVVPAQAPPDLPPTTWGRPRDLSTWSHAKVADLALDLRRAELEALATAPRTGALDPIALRELLALQASDWAFLERFDQAGPYPRERHRAHRERLDAALRGLGSPAAARNLAVHASAAPLLEP